MGHKCALSISSGTTEDLMWDHLLLERCPTITNEDLVWILPGEMPYGIGEGRPCGPPEEPINQRLVQLLSITCKKLGPLRLLDMPTQPLPDVV